MFGVLVTIMIVGLIAVGIMVKLVYFSGDRISISYSEIIGDEIIEHDKTYDATINEEQQHMHINALKLKRPIPSTKYMCLTKTGKKKLYLIKIDNDRYGYRIPTTDNQVWVEKRDKYGEVIRDDKGKVILIKHKYKFCDNVIEPDTIHWAEAEQFKNQKRHENKKNFWETIAPFMGLAMIFLFAVISLQISTKDLRADKNAMFEMANDAEARAQETQQSLNNLLNKVSGTKVFDNSDNREKFLNESKDPNAKT